MVKIAPLQILLRRILPIEEVINFTHKLLGFMKYLPQQIDVGVH